MKKKGILIILVLFIPGLLFLNYIGVFTRVKIREKMVGPFQMVYKEQKGEYKFTGAIIASVYKSIKAENLPGSRGFGMYYDNPKITKKEDLRSDAGVILNNAIEDTNRNGFLRKEFPLQKCVLIEYPNKNFLSVYTGMAKVYPKLFDYVVTNGYKKVPVMEIYEESKIIYLMPLVKP